MKQIHRSAGTLVAAVAAGSLLLLGAPAAAAGSNVAYEAQRAAEIVEKATGASDLRPDSVVLGGGGNSFVSSAGDITTVRVPAESGGRVEAFASDGRGFGLGLPETASVTGVKAGAGTVVYPNAAKATDIAVQLTADGSARALVTLKDRTAPKEHRFDLRLAEGMDLQPGGDGGYLVVKEAADGVEVVGKIDAPWAKDAHGDPIATHYKVDGGALVQTVEVNESTAFPVVADPKVSFGRGIYLKYSKGEVKSLLPKIRYLPAGSSACGAFGTVGGMVCGVLSYGVLNNIKNVWEYAAANGRCIEVKLTYASVYTGIKHYAC
ncbi:hypothetical protein GCM10014713_60520 [Streptomyces purpureus]|uniref:Uncharacterized protein n=2 Tax=Streptomyces purpureus TaxID=1951 RepID=A0A918HFV4_9ACTN|nr:hypothetical protein GCM10014713_60520 [Streptomyces purpureus]